MSNSFNWDPKYQPNWVSFNWDFEDSHCPDPNITYFVYHSLAEQEGQDEDISISIAEQDETAIEPENEPAVPMIDDQDNATASSPKSVTNDSDTVGIASRTTSNTKSSSESDDGNVSSSNEEPSRVGFNDVDVEAARTIIADYTAMQHKHEAQLEELRVENEKLTKYAKAEKEQLKKVRSIYGEIKHKHEKLGKEYTKEKEKNDQLMACIKALKEKIAEIQESNKEDEEPENNVSSEKLANVQKQLAEQKKIYEDKINEMSELSKAELAAFKSNSDEMVDKLKADITAKNEELTKNQERINKLQGCVTEEKANNDGLNNKIKALEDEVKVTKESEEKTKGEYKAIKAEKDKQAQEYAALQASAAAGNEEAQDLQIPATKVLSIANIPLTRSKSYDLEAGVHQDTVKSLLYKSWNEIEEEEDDVYDTVDPSSPPKGCCLDRNGTEYVGVDIRNRGLTKYFSSSIDLNDPSTYLNLFHIYGGVTMNIDAFWSYVNEQDMKCDIDTKRNNAQWKAMGICAFFKMLYTLYKLCTRTDYKWYHVLIDVVSAVLEIAYVSIPFGESNVAQLILSIIWDIIFVVMVILLIRQKVNKCKKEN